MSASAETAIAAIAARPEGPVDCERKFVADASRHAAALDVLRQFCLPDPKHAEGWIESIYFDDASLSSYWEKANGDALKRKVRIRWYPGASAAGDGRVRAFLEVKDRICAGRAKIHRPFVAPSALVERGSLDDPALVALLYGKAVAAGFPLAPGLQPSVAIRYHRFRFFCPVTGSRVCLDSALSSDRVNAALLPEGGALTSSRIVCEGKSSAHRSWPWSGTLRRLGFRACSFSKYGEFMEARLNGGL